MTLKVSINSQEWVDSVFDHKNHMYGAYILRVGSSKRLTKAFLIALTLFLVGVFTPLLIKIIRPEKKAAYLNAIEFSDIKLDRPKKNPEVIPIAVSAPPVKLRSSIKYVPPVIRPDDEVTDQDKFVNQQEVLASKAAVGVVTYKGSNDADAVVAKSAEETELVSNQIAEDKEPPFIVVEQMPEFPGGEAELLKYLSANIRYPVVALENGIQGKVICEFVINRDGKVTDVKVIRGVDPTLDAEALRVINHMPHWKAGKQRGVAVRVRYTLPVFFKLQ